MRVSAIKSYDYVSKFNNSPQQPCPAPVPYATNPNFGHASKVVTALKRLGQKVLGFVAAVSVVLYMSVRQNNGQEQVRRLGIADDADYTFDFNGTKYAVTVDDLLGFGIYNEKNESLYTLPMNEDMYNMISHLAAVDGNPNELSPQDVRLANTQNLNLPNHKVTRIQRNDMPPNESEVRIERMEGGRVASYCGVNALDQPTAYYK
ncbi:hypothetical protein J6S88_03670 [bacterium]|nr:hypothetical protein [bacterium]